MCFGANFFFKSMHSRGLQEVQLKCVLLQKPCLDCKAIFVPKHLFSKPQLCLVSPTSWVFSSRGQREVLHTPVCGVTASLSRPGFPSGELNPLGTPAGVFLVPSLTRAGWLGRVGKAPRLLLLPLGGPWKTQPPWQSAHSTVLMVKEEENFLRYPELV